MDYSVIPIVFISFVWDAQQAPQFIMTLKINLQTVKRISLNSKAVLSHYKNTTFVILSYFLSRNRPS